MQCGYILLGTNFSDSSLKHCLMLTWWSSPKVPAFDDDELNLRFVASIQKEEFMPQMHTDVTP